MRRRPCTAGVERNPRWRLHPQTAIRMLTPRGLSTRTQAGFEQQCGHSSPWPRLGRSCHSALAGGRSTGQRLPRLPAAPRAARLQPLPSADSLPNACDSGRCVGVEPGTRPGGSHEGGRCTWTGSWNGEQSLGWTQALWCRKWATQWCLGCHATCLALPAPLKCGP